MTTWPWWAQALAGLGAAMGAASLAFGVLLPLACWLRDHLPTH